MSNKMKQKYVPCELSVVQFKVERGFAASQESLNFYGAFANYQNTWTMTKGDDQHDFMNEQYGRDDQFNWFNNGGQNN